MIQEENKSCCNLLGQTDEKFGKKNSDEFYDGNNIV